MYTVWLRCKEGYFCAIRQRKQVKKVKVNVSSCWFVTHQPGRPRWSLSFLSITSEMFGMASDFSFISSLLAEFGEAGGPADTSLHSSDLTSQLQIFHLNICAVVLSKQCWFFWKNRFYQVKTTFLEHFWLQVSSLKSSVQVSGHSI